VDRRIGGVRAIPQFEVETRKIICTINAIESVNARLRRAVSARAHFPTELAAMKCLYVALMGLDPTGRGRGRWVIRWKPALNAFNVACEGRLSTTHN
jgi:putative transposase